VVGSYKGRVLQGRAKGQLTRAELEQRVHGGELCVGVGVSVAMRRRRDALRWLRTPEGQAQRGVLQLLRQVYDRATLRGLHW
jgi:hypothetical protein